MTDDRSWMCTSWLCFGVSLIFIGFWNGLLAIILFIVSIILTLIYFREDISASIRERRQDSYVCPVCLTNVEKKLKHCPNCGHRI